MIWRPLADVFKRSPRSGETPHHLARALAIAYSLLVVYASLHPFTGWRDNGADLLGFLFARWPRHWTVFDLVVNILAYAPLGLLWIAASNKAHSAALRCYARAACILLGGALLSLLMETLQNFLPGRVSSNIDLMGNTLGTLIGVTIGCIWHGRAVILLHTLRRRSLLAGAAGDAGLTLLALWLLAQLAPETLPLASGDIRALFGIQAAFDYAPEEFIGVEAAIVAAQTLAAGAVASCLLRSHWPILLLLVTALGVKSFVLALTLGPAASFSWLSLGVVYGLAVGALGWFLVSWLPPTALRTVTALALLLGTALVNLSPDNPYLEFARQTWNAGQLLNFFGLTHLVSSIWPFLALAWLMLPTSATTRQTKP